MSHPSRSRLCCLSTSALCCADGEGCSGTAPPWQLCVWFPGPCLENIVLPLAGTGLAVYRLGIQGSINKWSSDPPRRCWRSSTSGKGQQPALLLLSFPREGFSSRISIQPQLHVLEKLLPSLEGEGREEGGDLPCRGGATQGSVLTASLSWGFVQTPLWQGPHSKGFHNPNQSWEEAVGCGQLCPLSSKVAEMKRDV